MNNLFPDMAKLNGLRKAISEFQNNMLTIRKNMSEALAKIRERLPDKTNVTQKFLVKRGWFIPYRFLPVSKLNWISECIKEEKELHEIENYLIEFIEDLAPSFIEYSEKCFEDRHRILYEAFKAHNEGHYALSVPTFLAQADGMFRALFGKEFYANNSEERNKINREIRRQLNQGKNKVTAASLTYLFIKQLHEESQLHETFSETKIYEEGENIETLNRNEVLHGVAKSYDTKKNSIKAIGLIELLIMTKNTLSEKGAV